MFTDLTQDELKSLMAALITKPHGFSSNRMARMLAGHDDLFRVYMDTATEIADLYGEVGKVLCARYEAAA